jgi:hypothetical protein
MRRKAEILKYSSNTQSTQTNNLTKKQQWAQIAKGNYQRFSPTLYSATTSPITGATTYQLKCDVSGGIIKTPSTASDVPGPTINLYDDPNVLLYMYQSNQDAYAIIPNKIPDPYQIKDLGATMVPSPTYINYFNPTIFGNIIITTGVIDPQSSFNITVPIGLRFMGQVAQTSNTVQYSFTYPTNTALNVFYGSSNLPNPTIPYDSIVNPNSSYQLNGVFLSGQSSKTITFQVADPTKPFVLDVYIGSIQFKNIRSLATQPLMTYSFAFSLVNLSNTLSITTPGHSSSDVITYALFVNPPDPITTPYYSKNCVGITSMPTYYPMVIQPLGK